MSFLSNPGSFANGMLKTGNQVARSVSSGLTVGAGIADKFGRVQKYAKALKGMIDPTQDNTPPEPSIPSYYKFVSMVRQDGFARNNHFTVEFVPPKYNSAEQDKSLKIPGTSFTIPAPPGDTRNIVMLCHSVGLPGVNIATTPVITTGPGVEMPSTGRNYGPLQTSFYVDSRFKTKAMFDRWIDIIQHPVNKNFSYFKDYAIQMVIGVFDRNGDLKYRIDIMDAYPKTVGDIQMSYDGRDIMKLDVTWSYTRWTATPIPDLSEVSLSEKLRGYAGTVLDVQNTVNEVAGNVSRALDMVGAGDLGGASGQSYGGF